MDYFENLLRITNYLERLTGRKSVHNRLYPMSPNIRMMQSMVQDRLYEELSFSQMRHVRVKILDVTDIALGNCV